MPHIENKTQTTICQCNYTPYNYNHKKRLKKYTNTLQTTRNRQHNRRIQKKLLYQQHIM